MTQPLVTIKKMYYALDPGIADLVCALRALGFNTCDSGDGVTKPARGDEDVLDVPHVHMSVDPDKAIAESHRLWTWIQTTDDPRFIDPIIQSTYSPIDGLATLSLLGVVR